MRIEVMMAMSQATAAAIDSHGMGTKSADN